MADEKKIYVGNGNKRDGKYGTFRSVSICLSDLPPEHITKSEKNGKKCTRWGRHSCLPVTWRGSEIQ